jgi:hypothetical protein
VAKRSIVGLSGPFSRRGPALCARCGNVVEATWPWPGWGRLRVFWLVAVGVIGLLSPILMSDVSVMLPSAMMFVLAIGPISALARIKPTCLHCGARVEPVPPSQPSAAKPHA